MSHAAFENVRQKASMLLPEECVSCPSCLVVRSRAHATGELSLLTQEEGLIYSLADGHTAVEGILQLCPFGAEKASRALYVLERLEYITLHDPSAARKQAQDARRKEQERAAYESHLAAMEENFGKLDYFSLFETDPMATPARLKYAYRRAAMKIHPDRFSYNPAMKQRAEKIAASVAEAYNTISDESSRRFYLIGLKDKAGKSGQQMVQGTGRTPQDMARAKFHEALGSLAMNDFRSALPLLQAAVTMDSSNRYHLITLAQAQMIDPALAGNAGRNFMQVVQSFPEWTEPRLALARLCKMQMKRNDAQAHVAVVLKREPDNEDALKMKAALDLM